MPRACGREGGEGAAAPAVATAYDSREKHTAATGQPRCFSDVFKATTQLPRLFVDTDNCELLRDNLYRAGNCAPPALVRQRGSGLNRVCWGVRDVRSVRGGERALLLLLLELALELVVHVLDSGLEAAARRRDLGEERDVLLGHEAQRL
eukprot:scaffold41074_cov55-Phaeocystis_antarctica.AAC.2